MVIQKWIYLSRSHIQSRPSTTKDGMRAPPSPTPVNPSILLQFVHKCQRHNRGTDLRIASKIKTLTVDWHGEEAGLHCFLSDKRVNFEGFTLDRNQ